MEDQTKGAANRLSTLCAGGVRLVLGFGLLAIAAFGIYICTNVASTINPPSVHRQPGMQGIAGLLAWMVLFGPMALVGYLILRSPKATSSKNIDITFRPRKPFNATMPLVDHELRQPVAGASNVDDRHVAVDTLDDQTVMKLSSRVTLVVKVARILLGMSAIVTAIVVALSAKASAGPATVDLIAIAIGLALLGVAILRGRLQSHTERAGWFLPLQIFTRVLANRAAAEAVQQARRKSSEATQLDATNPKIISAKDEIDARE